MRVDCFLDTNVLVYATSSSKGDASKQNRALKLIQHAGFGLSAQVLQEFYLTMTRKLKTPLAPEMAVALMDEYRAFPMAPTDYQLIVSAAEISVRHGISYWDGAIIAAAEILQARVLYTEDLNHGQRYGSVRVENPFRDI